LQPRTFTESGITRSVDPISGAVAAPKGWYMEFPVTSGQPSERVVSPPLVKNFSTIEDRVIFVTTIPTTDPCDRGGEPWLMELALEDGGAFSAPVIDTNNDGLIDGSDAVVAGVKLPSSLGITKTPLWLSGGTDNSGSAFKFFTGSKGTTHSVKQTDDPEPPSGPGSAVFQRIYWQEIR
jgi:type IV pilus assembly protein PilY1